MYGVIRRYVRDDATAEDLLHDGFITVYQRIGQWRGDGSFEGWCRKIFVNTALTYIRQRNKFDLSSRPVEELQRANGECDKLEQMCVDELAECLNALPEGYRTILNLYAVEGYSHKEIGRMLGIDSTTSRSQYSRAKMSLQRMINEKNIRR